MQISLVELSFTFYAQYFFSAKAFEFEHFFRGCEYLLKLFLPGSASICFFAAKTFSFRKVFFSYNFVYRKYLRFILFDSCVANFCESRIFALRYVSIPPH